ncbi:MAG: glutaminyl-peptide cyclotransferase [Chitinophagaceae bacterium]
MKKLFYIIILIGTAACNSNGGKEPGNGPEGPKSIGYSVISSYPHDTSSYTEGLLFYKGELYESTGQKGSSRLIKVDLNTGKSLKSISLDKEYFGEGIVIINDTIYQLTYQEKVGFMYSLKDFKKIGEFKFAAKEGWGMTTDGKQIIASDGTSQLYYYEPGTFRLIKTQDVTEAGSLAFNLNELEYIDGYIYANQWQSPYILKIDPATGLIVGKADFSGICDTMKVNNPYSEVFNGIAYDSTTKKIYVTGKYWPLMYEVQFGQ